jgi:cob(I)alamin adenosyltransferase
MRPSLSTTGGDRGKTGLFGGERVSKSSNRLHAYGTVDELSAVLGLILTERDLPEEIREQLHEVQKDLFCLGADLATPLGNSSARVVRIAECDTQRIEEWGAALEGDLPALQKFILPSGCRAAALLHQARTICRRAERWLVHVSNEEPINDQSLIYINRLSDYFFLVSRSVNKAADMQETEWLP